MKELDNAVSTVSDFVVQHNTELLTGIGLGGLLTAGILAVGVTPRVLSAIKEEEKRTGKNKLGAWETVKVSWKYYILPTLLAGVSSYSIIKAESINLKRNAALTTACAASESLLKSYTGKVVETIGEKKEKDIREAAIQKQIEEHDTSKPYDTGKGKTVCFLTWNNYTFYANRDFVDAAFAKLNEAIAYDNDVSLNDFFGYLHLYELDTSEEGDYLGFKSTKGKVEPIYSAHLKNDIPMCAIGFSRPPIDLIR